MGFTKVGQAAFTLAVGTGTEDKTIPGSLLENDVVFLGVASDSNVRFADIASAGWTEIEDSTNTGPGMMLACKRMGAVPDSVVTITRDPVSICAVAMQVWRGVDATTMFDAPVAEASSGLNGDPDPPSITTVTDGALVLVVGTWDDDDAASSVVAPSGYGDLLAADTGQSSTSAGATIAFASRIVATAGTEDPGVIVSDAHDLWYAATIALRPAADPGGATGDVAVTLADVTAASTGALAGKGQASPSLAAAVLTASGTAQIAGQTTRTLANATLAAAGILRVSGSAAAAVADLGLSSAGALKVVGAAAPVLANVTLAAGGGGLPASGVLNGAIASASLAALGALRVTGHASVSLAATIAATGQTPIIAVAAIPLAGATVAATGTSLPSGGWVDVALADLAISSAGALAGVGALALDLPAATMVAIGAFDGVTAGQMAAELQPVVIAAQGRLANVAQLEAALAGATVISAGGSSLIVALPPFGVLTLSGGFVATALPGGNLLTPAGRAMFSGRFIIPREGT